MQPEIRAALDTLFSHQSLDRNSVQEAIGAIMDGRCEPVEISALLTAFAMKGETETEIAGAAAAMRERAIRIPTAQTGLIDTCGTGGGNLHTFNISTAAALVVAATGLPVAKHGNPHPQRQVTDQQQPPSQDDDGRRLEADCMHDQTNNCNHAQD